MINEIELRIRGILKRVALVQGLGQQGGAR
jgi:hypothetical protein